MSDLSQDEGTGPTIATGWSVDLLDTLDVPIIQGIVSTGTRQEWEENSLGLGPIDTAMNVALPEFGRPHYHRANFVQGRNRRF